MVFVGLQLMRSIYNIVNFITEQLDCDKDILEIFIDICKALDPLSHQIFCSANYMILASVALLTNGSKAI